MSKQAKNTIKSWFKNGAFPNQFHFWDWMDSFFHKDEQIPASQIDQLQDLLDAKVDRKDLPDGEMSMDDISGLNSALDGKVDKEEGKALSSEDFTTTLKDKLEAIDENANNYQHPATHSVDIINETEEKSFISSAEKQSLNDHFTDQEIHKSSVQIRSEIEDTDLPISIARQSDVVDSASTVVNTIRDGVDEAYNTLKKVYDWIFVHDGNTEIHKTSEQIRSEIVDEDIPETIARLTDLDTSSGSGNIVYDWNVEKSLAANADITTVNLDQSLLGNNLKISSISSQMSIDFVKPVAGSMGVLEISNAHMWRDATNLFKVDGSVTDLRLYVDRRKNGGGQYVLRYNSSAVVHYSVSAAGIVSVYIDKYNEGLGSVECQMNSSTTKLTIPTPDYRNSYSNIISSSLNQLDIKDLLTGQKFSVKLNNGLTTATPELNITGSRSGTIVGETKVAPIPVGEFAVYSFENIGHETISRKVYPIASGRSTPTLQEVAEAGATTDQAAIFTGGIRTTDNNSEKFGLGALANDDGTNNRNSAFGSQALAANTTGTSNCAFGVNALATSTGAHQNTAIGDQAGESLTTGNTNTLVGYFCGSGLRTTARNTCMGWSAGSGSGVFTDASDNTYLGYQAGRGVSSRGFNTAVGSKAMNTAVNQSNCVAVGFEAGRTGFLGEDNTFLGYRAGKDVGYTNNSTGIGANSVPTISNQVVLGNANIVEVKSTGSFNSSNTSPLGSAPGGTNATSGKILTADGSGGSFWEDAAGGGGTTLQAAAEAGNSINTAVIMSGGITSFDTGSPLGTEKFGLDALNNTATGQSNTAFGNEAGNRITTGSGNSMFGRRAAQSLTTGASNTAVGNQAMGSSTQSTNSVAVGSAALYNMTTSIGFNTVVGANAARNLTTGGSNSFFGYQSGLSCVQGSYSVAVGRRSLYTMVNPQECVAIGNEASLGSTAAYSVTSVGARAGKNYNGTYNTFLGYKSGGDLGTTTTLHRVIAMGPESIPTKNQQMMVGTSGNPMEVATYGQFVSLGSSPLGSALSGTNVAAGLVLTADGSGGSSWQAAGGGSATPTLQAVTDAGNSTTNNIVTTGTATATNFILSSDERLKTFKEESVVDVSSIDIRKFNYNDDETNRDRYGVSAQELQKVAPEMVYEDEEGMLSVGYTDFLLARIAKLEKLVYKLMEDK